MLHRVSHAGCQADRSVLVIRSLLGKTSTATLTYKEGKSATIKQSRTTEKKKKKKNQNRIEAWAHVDARATFS